VEARDATVVATATLRLRAMGTLWTLRSDAGLAMVGPLPRGVGVVFAASSTVVAVGKRFKLYIGSRQYKPAFFPQPLSFLMSGVASSLFSSRCRLATAPTAVDMAVVVLVSLLMILVRGDEHGSASVETVSTVLLLYKEY
jgi:hypothetical protein